MSTTIQNIAIIGAGIGGLALALGLHSKNIPCTIYEQSPESGRFSGAIMLSPKSLRILDSYGVYERTRSNGWSFESADVKTPAGQTTDRYFLGSQKLFGYKALRIYRNVFVTELQAVVKERGVPIVFDTKYPHVVVESQHGVRIAFKDSTEVSALLLIGADGIHSRVRGYVAPGIEPIYNGIVSIVGAVKRSKSVILSDATIPGPLMYGGKAGSFVLAPQDVDGSTLMAGTQKKYPMQDREGWARLASNKKRFVASCMKISTVGQRWSAKQSNELTWTPCTSGPRTSSFISQSGIQTQARSY